MTSVLLFTLLLCGFVLELNAESPLKPDVRCGRFRHRFIWYNGRCYQFVKQERDWYDAERACNRLGGHLASMDTQKEYNFISGLIYSETGSYTSTWVGANKGLVWTWTDGTPFTFSSWSPGEPNNAGGDENCMEINLRGRKYVNDANCEIKLAYVCSKEPLWLPA